MLPIISALIISYLLGSIPTAYIFGRVAKGVDIRKFGSGNVGATNALRVLGRKAGIAVLLIDVLKGFSAVVFLGSLPFIRSTASGAQTLRILLGLACVAGHIWTVFLRFRGGKGMATSLGVFMGLAFSDAGIRIAVAFSVLVWFLVFIFSHIISLASVAAAIALPLLMLACKLPVLPLAISFLISLIVVLRHKSNLIRLLEGKEKRIW
jgi:glycerol-3-phosphate acyltransferase PlsY